MGEMGKKILCHSGVLTDIVGTDQKRKRDVQFAGCCWFCDDCESDFDEVV